MMKERTLVLMLDSPSSEACLLALLNTPAGKSFIRQAVEMLDLDNVCFGKGVMLEGSINHGSISCPA